MQVVARIKFPGKVIERVVERLAIKIGKIARRRAVGDAADGKANADFLRHGSAGGDSEIAVAATELAEGKALAGQGAGRFDRFDQFIVGARRRHHTGEEFLGRHAASLLLRR